MTDLPGPTIGRVTDAEDGPLRRTFDWFEVNSGWAPPDEETLAEWLADGVCRCPDECLVAPEGTCEHGLASWYSILATTASDRASRRRLGR